MSTASTICRGSITIILAGFLLRTGTQKFIAGVTVGRILRLYRGGRLMTSSIARGIRTSRGFRTIPHGRDRALTQHQLILADAQQATFVAGDKTALRQRNENLKPSLKVALQPGSNGRQRRSWSP